MEDDTRENGEGEGAEGEEEGGGEELAAREGEQKGRRVTAIACRMGRGIFSCTPCFDPHTWKKRTSSS